MLGPVVLSSIADYSDLRTPFYMMSGMLIVNALMLAVFAKEIIKTRFSKGKATGEAV